MSLSDWVLILCFILINGFYVAAEFGSVAVRRSRIRQLAREGNRRAKYLQPVLEDPRRLDAYIAACQIGITLSSLVLGAFGQARVAVDLAPLLRGFGLPEVTALSTASIAVLVFLTVLQVVLGELVPKSLALQYPTQAALLTCMPMRWSLSLYRVFIVILNGSGLVLLRLFGAGQAVHGHLHSPDEIDLLIADSADGGLLEPDEQKRLREALRLGRRTARELMTPRRLVHMLRADASFETNVAEAISSPYTRLPVYHESEDNVVGFVHLRDLTAHFAETNGAGTLDAVLRPLPNVPASLPIEKLLPILRQRGQRLALVRDEYGGLEGIVTLQDVLNEILGTPPEEAQRWQPPPERLADGRFRLPGLLRLDEVATLTGTPLTSTEVTTLGGLLLEKLGRLPQPGERVLLGDLEVEVEAMDHQAVVSVLAEPQRSDSG